MVDNAAFELKLRALLEQNCSILYDLEGIVAARPVEWHCDGIVQAGRLQVQQSRGGGYSLVGERVRGAIR